MQKYNFSELIKKHNLVFKEHIDKKYLTEEFIFWCESINNMDVNKLMDAYKYIYEIVEKAKNDKDEWYLKSREFLLEATIALADSRYTRIDPDVKPLDGIYINYYEDIPF